MGDRRTRSLGWISFTALLWSVALVFIAHFWTAGARNPVPEAFPLAPADDADIWWSIVGAHAHNLSGYVAAVSLASIAPAVLFAVLRRRRVQQAEVTDIGKVLRA